MTTIPPGFLDRLRAEISLYEVASRWVEWDTRKSDATKGDYWAPCPFHQEKSASFHVNERKGFYYCFGCQAKGDAISLVRTTQDVSFMTAVRKLAFLAGLDNELVHQDEPAKLTSNEILQIKEFIVQNFNRENFLEVGVLTGWSNYITSHHRLLRSLDWGDDDYSGCVMDMLTQMLSTNDGSLEKLQQYVESKFSDELQAVVEVAAYSSTKRSLGYNFITPRNDVISVMMPFGARFSGVYDAIKASCETTHLPAKRADEVWNNSVLITDILELINHSAVVICDLTGRNENVFYELGIAHAWGKQVVPITQNAEDVPFDLQHHRYLHYLNNTEGHEKLKVDLSSRLQNLVERRLPF